MKKGHCRALAKKTENGYLYKFSPFLLEKPSFIKNIFYINSCNSDDERASLAASVGETSKKGVDWAKLERNREKERRETRCSCRAWGKERAGIG